MAGMNPNELEAFLNSDVICRLGCLDEAGYPYVVPCWFQYADGGFYVIPRARSAWAGYLQANPRAFLCIDRESGERVLVRGDADLLEEPNVGGRWVAIAREMAQRYRGEAGLSYLERTLNEPRWLFFVRPHKITSWDARGDWANRYKHYEW